MFDGADVVKAWLPVMMMADTASSDGLEKEILLRPLLASVMVLMGEEICVGWGMMDDVVSTYYVV